LGDVPIFETKITSPKKKSKLRAQKKLHRNNTIYGEEKSPKRTKKAFKKLSTVLDFFVDKWHFFVDNMWISMWTTFLGTIFIQKVIHMSCG
jgi:hypothetical protein